MPISIPILLSYLLLIGSACAQVSAPDCTDSTFSWSYNSLQQNPCLVAAYLAAVCNNGTLIITALQPQHYYTGPSGVDNGDTCKCNTVVYNLISACDACQKESWISYSTWSFNCTTNAAGATFPEQVPSGTRVPHWAYLDTSIKNNWNLSAAQFAGINPEVTGTASIVPISTSTAATSTSHHSSAGAIAGGVLGGIIGAALIAGVIVWFTIRRRRARSSPYLFQGGEKEQPPRPLAEGAPKLYDPADPSTYPSKEYLSGANQPLGSTGYLQPSDGRYSGLPEI
ncbi:hypothetical protein EDB92DRAFT_197829 [Lactarius akahatsu]|uniref:Uncharacterized protein n=1 Tax=Lactarius akahatsu TaxID=416441 RepID=A0AAD4LLV4_9AGAM|nr:hypothetical protein EDB92DRAFT_197829 [Lactarius akahatsu]